MSTPFQRAMVSGSEDNAEVSVTMTWAQMARFNRLLEALRDAAMSEDPTPIEITPLDEFRQARLLKVLLAELSTWTRDE